MKVLNMTAIKPFLEVGSTLAAFATLAGWVAKALPPLAALVSILWILWQWYHSAPMKARRAGKPKPKGKAKPAFFASWRRSWERYLRNAVIVVNGLFAAAFPFAEQIIAGVQASMPQLAEYLPPNMFKAVGISVVLLNIVIGALQVRKVNAADATTGGAKT